jgi:hypothetical protein
VRVVSDAAVDIIQGTAVKIKSRLIPLFILATAWTVPSVAATPSVNGSNIYALPSIIDVQSNAWTIVGSVVKKNGVMVGNNYNVNTLLELNSTFYAKNSANNWYVWNGVGPYWTPVSDPRVVSTSGSSIGMGSNTLVDSAKHVWTLSPTGYAFCDGYVAGGNYATKALVYFNGVIYAENASNGWSSWNGYVWSAVTGDPRGPALVQYAVHTSLPCPATNPSCVPQFENNSAVTFSKTTAKGNTIWVAATVSDYGGIHTMTVTDSQNNVYHLLNQLNDGAPGAQSLAQFYATDVEGGPDTITVNWTSDNYKAVVAAEISGVSTASLVGNNAHIQDGKLTAGAGNVTANGISIPAGKTPSLVVALTMDTNGGGSDIGGTGNCAISAGSGFSQVAQFWNWAPVGVPSCNLATLETGVVSSTGNVSAGFTSTHLTDPYVTVSAAFH